jgi:hypothetical protein
LREASRDAANVPVPLQICGFQVYFTVEFSHCPNSLFAIYHAFLTAINEDKKGSFTAGANEWMTQKQNKSLVFLEIELLAEKLRLTVVIHRVRKSCESN